MQLLGFCVIDDVGASDDDDDDDHDDDDDDDDDDVAFTCRKMAWAPLMQTNCKHRT